MTGGPFSFSRAIPDRDEAVVSSERTELGFEVSVLEGLEGAGRYPDLSRLRERRPDALKGIVAMLAAGMPVRLICETFKPMSPCTVLAVQEDAVLGAAVVTLAHKVTGSMRRALQLGVELKLQEWSDPEAKAPHALELKLLNEMIALREGGATSRTEHVHVLVSEAEERLMRLLERGEARVMEEVELGSPDALRMGNGGENVGAVSQAGGLDGRELGDGDRVVPGDVIEVGGVGMGAIGDELSVRELRDHEGAVVSKMGGKVGAVVPGGEGAEIADLGGENLKGRGGGGRSEGDAPSP